MGGIRAIEPDNASLKAVEAKQEPTGISRIDTCFEQEDIEFANTASHNLITSSKIPVLVMLVPCKQNIIILPRFLCVGCQQLHLESHPPTRSLRTNQINQILITIQNSTYLRGYGTIDIIFFFKWGFNCAPVIVLSGPRHGSTQKGNSCYLKIP